MANRPPHRNAAEPSPEAIERDVRENILRQPFGAGTVADLQLPREFLRRYADRVIISSFNERFHAIAGEPPPRPEPSPPPDSPSANDCNVRIVDGVSLEENAWGSLPEQTGEVLRGWRAGASGGVIRPPASSDPYELRRAAGVVAKSLAREELVRTTLDAALALRPMLKSRDPAELAELLGRAGVPLDLVAMVELGGEAGFDRGGFTAWLAAKLQTERPAALREALARAVLRFAPTLAGFRPSDDAGATEPAAIRLQLTRGDDWLGEGDGGALDIARQLSRSLPTTPIIMTCRDDYADVVARHARAWQSAFARSAPVTIIRERVTVSQWAQDNTRPGTIERNGSATPVVLLPRYASRGEEAAWFVPGDTILAESLPQAGIAAARSPLHFQGGNLIVVEDPVVGDRVLLVGEAEITRNIALGLSAEQVIDALRAELNVKRVVVLPAASYHIDYEVLCVRDDATNQIVAFVADNVAAERLILHAGIDALHRGGALSNEAATRLRDTLISTAPASSLLELLTVTRRDVPRLGGYPLDVVNLFTTGAPGESAVGNFLTFVDALDAAAARERLDEQLALPPHGAAAYAARRRLDADRALIRGELVRLGWRVVAVPSFNSGNWSIPPLNAVLSSRSLLIPDCPGLFGRIAREAAAAVAAEVRDINPVAFAVSESQRRNGAIRCAVSVIG